MPPFATILANVPLIDPAGVEIAAQLPTAAFTEGPAVHADGTVFFTDILNSRIIACSPSGQLHVFRQPSGRSNGQTFDERGWLYHCEGAEMGPGGWRRIARTHIGDGRYEVLTERYQGVRYNSPNDLVVDRRQRVYFTDPRYGDRSDMEMDIEGVYRWNPDGSVVRILQQPQIQRPNGLAVTNDMELLYLIDSANQVGGHRKVWCFDLDDEGNPHQQRLVFDFGTGRGGDGMRLDQQGNLYVAAGIHAPRGPHETDEVPAGIYRINPDGQLLGFTPIPEDVLTNCAFGGDDGCTLYVTAGRTLYRLRTPVAGQVVYPAWPDAPLD